MAEKLVLVWNRDKPRYALELKGFRVIRSSEQACLETVLDSLERCILQTKRRLEACGKPAK